MVAGTLEINPDESVRGHDDAASAASETTPTYPSKVDNEATPLRPGIKLNPNYKNALSTAARLLMNDARSEREQLAYRAGVIEHDLVIWPTNEATAAAFAGLASGLFELVYDGVPTETLP